MSWILPPGPQSEHPDYLPAAGAAFVASKIEAIAANAKVRRKTAFILNCDENDGLFDHVPAPTPPAGTPDEFVGGLPIGGGFRVPAIIVSPWTVGGWVATEPFDHTSALRFLEKLTGVEEPDISDWRRRAFGDLTSAFRLASATPLAPTLPSPPADGVRRFCARREGGALRKEEEGADAQGLPLPVLRPVHTLRPHRLDDAPAGGRHALGPVRQGPGQDARRHHRDDPALVVVPGQRATRRNLVVRHHDPAVLGDVQSEPFGEEAVGEQGRYGFVGGAVLHGRRAVHAVVVRDGRGPGAPWAGRARCAT